MIFLFETNKDNFQPFEFVKRQVKEIENNKIMTHFFVLSFRHYNFQSKIPKKVLKIRIFTHLHLSDDFNRSLQIQSVRFFFRSSTFFFYSFIKQHFHKITWHFQTIIFLIRVILITLLKLWFNYLKLKTRTNLF